MRDFNTTANAVQGMHSERGWYSINISISQLQQSLEQGGQGGSRELVPESRKADGEAC